MSDFGTKWFEFERARDIRAPVELDALRAAGHDVLDIRDTYPLVRQAMRRELADEVVVARERLLADTVDADRAADLAAATTELVLFLAWELEVKP